MKIHIFGGTKNRQKREPPDQGKFDKRFVRSKPYVHTYSNPVFLRSEKYGKLKITPNKSVRKSREKAIDRRIWEDIAAGIPGGIPSGTRRDREWV